MEFETTENLWDERDYYFEQNDNSSHSKRRTMVRRKSDTIYYIKDANVTMPMNVSKEDNLHADPVRDTKYNSNTRSSFQTYTFEDSADPSDTEKCIAFWKSVMEKNLQPVKECIITKGVNAEGSRKQLETRLESTNEVIKKTYEAVQDEYLNLWKGIVEEIQNEKLEQIKTNARTPCKVCDSLKNLIDIPSDKTITKDNVRDLKKKSLEPKKTIPQQKDSPKTRPRVVSLEEREVVIHTIEPTFEEKVSQETNTQESVSKSWNNEKRHSSRKSSLKSYTENDSIRMDSFDLAKSKMRMKRQVSMMLPSGEVEILKRSSESDVKWEFPDLREKTSYGFRKIRSSIDIMMIKKDNEDNVFGQPTKSITKATPSSCLKTLNTGTSISTLTGRQVSLLLPTGKVETIERQSVLSSDWDMPSPKLNVKSSILASVPSDEIYKKKIAKKTKSEEDIEEPNVELKEEECLKTANEETYGQIETLFQYPRYFKNH
ncbi:uncharacterized protein LOC130892555 isoform X2 [Diorhabda carinulata]|uniref:uncharacterized protein LOC130892555 isoform X2 n=1 Tax=Diorhabda carinulata TaxID=1163345 RepID=UPI0025A04059|nr:uncharacterized protein LOC130892555 isoform X2 [Diorhabda carinulata]